MHCFHLIKYEDNSTIIERYVLPSTYIHVYENCEKIDVKSVTICQLSNFCQSSSFKLQEDSFYISFKDCKPASLCT